MISGVVNTIEETIIQSKIIPLIDCQDFNISKNLCDLTIKAGCKTLEFALRHQNSLKNYELLRKSLKSSNPGICFGVGSVCNSLEAKKAISIGCEFIVGPGLSKAVAEECHKYDVYYIPGCATASEILSAKELGCELIKIFPVENLGGKKFLSTLMGPMPWLKAIPAGGISSNPDNIKEWLDIGAKAVTLGSSLYKKNSEKEYSFEIIEKNLNSLLKKIF